MAMQEIAASGSTMRRKPLALPVMSGSGFSLAIILMAAFVIPDEFSIYIGDVKITTLRLMLIFLCIPALMGLMARNGGKLYDFDKLYLAYVAWTVLCTLINRGAGGVERAGQFVLETAVVYVLIQASLTSIKKTMLLIHIVIWIVFIVMIFAIIENRTSEYFIQNFIREFYGIELITESISGERFGVIRAATIFTHPILYGIFCASMFAINWYTAESFASRFFKSVVIIIATSLSLSSAPLICIGMQITFIFFEYITRGIKNRANIIFFIVLIFYVIIEIAVYRGVFGIMVRFLINPETAYYRLLIVEYGMQNVWAHPIFGMRIEDWVRAPWMVNPTLDHNWIATAMNGGIPSVVLLFASLLLMARRMFAEWPKDMPLIFDHLRRGWCYMMMAVVFAGATVHFFDKLQAYFALLVALGAAIIRLMIDWRAQAAVLSDAGRKTSVERSVKRRVWL